MEYASNTLAKEHHEEASILAKEHHYASRNTSFRVPTELAFSMYALYYLHPKGVFFIEKSPFHLARRARILFPSQITTHKQKLS